MSFRKKIYITGFLLITTWLFAGFYLLMHYQRTQELTDTLIPYEIVKLKSIENLRRHADTFERYWSPSEKTPVHPIVLNQELIQFDEEILSLIKLHWESKAFWEAHGDHVGSPSLVMYVTGLIWYDTLSVDSERIQLSHLKELTAQLRNSAPTRAGTTIASTEKRILGTIHEIQVTIHALDETANKILEQKISYISHRGLFAKSIIFAVFTLAIILITFLIIDIHRILQSIGGIKTITSAFAEGKLDERLPVEGFEEIRTIAVSFNAMGERMQELDKLKSDFFNKLVHDFKSPLDNIKQSADVLISGITGETSDGKQKKFLEIIKKSSIQLRTMIQEQLDESKLIAGQSSLVYEQTDLRQLIRERMELQRPTATARQLNFAVKFTDATFVISCDRAKLSRVMDNLLSNAIKYAFPETTISVEIEDRVHEIELRVRDHGPGIPTTMLTQIFQKYVRIEHNRSTTGTGLGLYTAKYIVELHKGRIWASNYNDGAVLHVLLPKSPGQPRLNH